MQAEDISNGFNVINVRKMTATETAPNGQTYVVCCPLFLVTLTRNTTSQEIFKLKSLNHINIKVELYRAQSDTFIYSLPSAVPLSKVLEGSTSHNDTETRQAPKIPSKFTSD
jgi:hypothetical protein